MRRFVSALALAALVSSLPGSLMAQTGAAPVTPELSDRLRDAVAERQGLEPDGAASDLAAQLASSTQYDAETLDDLVAPVALYPDALLAQVLVAATFPDQIVSAGALIERGDDMTDAELSDALAAEEWDPSVLALLSGFPTVIARMADDMDWTTQLGAAMLHQDGDVLQAVQRMRTRAEGAGNLVSNEAQVVERTDETISIRPANPDVVYVPDYDPDVVYVSSRSPTPYVGPYTEPQPAPGIGGIGTNTLISGALGFGAGFLVNELLDDDNGGGNKNKNKNDGWDDYWRRDQVIDWRGRRVYPRPYRDVTPVSWGQERDQYWDRGSGKWRRDEAARRRDAEERRRLLYWSDEDDRQRQSAREDREFRAWRERARQEARQEERRREQRAERRQELRKNQALEAREVREAREAREAREERRAQQERREAQREREAAREKADKAAVAKAKAASVEKTRAAERARAAEKAENREKAARAAAREKERAQAARETRAKAQEKARKAESERKPAQAQKAENPSQKELVRQLKAKQKAEKAEKARAAEKKAAGRDEPQRKNSQERQQKAASKKCAPDDERKSCRKG